LLSALLLDINDGMPISGEEVGDGFNPLTLGVKGLLALFSGSPCAREPGEDTIILGFGLLGVLFSLCLDASSNSLLTKKLTTGFTSGSTVSTFESR
jgi:hypothetical protein